MNRRLKVGLIAANAALLAIGFILYVFGTLETVNRSLFGFQMKQSMSHQPSDRIVIIGIDDVSLKEIGRFPWDRSVYVELLEKLNQPGYEPNSINFDISFDEASDPASDAAFAEALSKYENIVLPVVGSMEDVRRGVTAKNGEYIPVYDVRKPLEMFAERALLAHINALVDDDGTIRRTTLMIQGTDGEPIPSLALNAARMAGYDAIRLLEGDFIAGDSAKGEIYIQFDAMGDEFWKVPFVNVLKGEFDPELFRNAIVLIGIDAVGFEYDHNPTTVDQDMRLVYAHANIIQQIMNDEVTVSADWYVTALLMLGLFAITVAAAWRMKTTYSVALFAVLIAALFAGQTVLYQLTLVYINIVYPLTVVVLVYILNIAVKSYHENKQKQFITKQFGRYISPELVKEIAASNMEIQLGGIKKELSILFLDIRGFTTLSERMQPEEVVGFLNEMFDLITNKTMENKGTIDKFIGDAAMLLFNAPLDVENHPYYAVKTAWDIQQGMVEVRRRIEEKYGVTVNCGIGINTGEVVVGNIGSYLRVDYTCIGDNVNTAARIESQTKAGQILVSEATYERTKDEFEYEFAGERMMKGKTVGVKLYEVLGPKS